MRSPSSALIRSPVPTATVLFITSVAPSGAPRSSTTDQTGARFASPEGSGGVSTHEKKICASAFSSSASSVNVSRSRLRSTSSARPGSWNGIRPARSASIFSGTTSRTTTLWPRSAKQAPVTRPTHPAPKTPRGGFSALTRPTLLVEGLEALRDREHRLVRHRVEERVHDPVARAAGAQHNHVQVRPVEVEVVLPPADHLAQVLVGERGRVVPVGLLDAPVLVAALREREADRFRVVELVDAVRRLGRERRRPLEHRRDLEREADLPRGGLAHDREHVRLPRPH